MIAALALVEGAAILAVSCAAVFGWSRAHVAAGISEWQALAVVVTVTLGTLVALYYADAYELHIVPSPARFLARLPRCLAVAAGPVRVKFLWGPNMAQAAAVG